MHAKLQILYLKNFFSKQNNSNGTYLRHVTTKETLKAPSISSSKKLFHRKDDMFQASLPRTEL
jgi:hypothetical protein